MPRILGAILAGGKATRMGGLNKALLATRPGQSTLAHLVRQFRQAGIHDLAILANDPAPYFCFDVTVLPDLHPGSGPLAGMEAALLRARQRGLDAACFIPCDVPGMTYREIHRLVDASDPPAHTVYACTSGGRGQFACSVVSTAALPIVTQSLLLGERSIERLLIKLKARPVLFSDASVFQNLNSLEDVEMWEQSRRRSRRGLPT